jgi:CBS domain-containing protein
MRIDPYRCRVKDVCSRDLVFVHADGTIHEALTLMVENRVSALPVVDKQGGCQGILSSTDVVEFALELDDELQDFGRAEDGSHQWLLDRLAEQDMDRRSVQDLMTATVATVGLETPLDEAAREMIRHRVHRLPVVDEKERLVGIISTMDILRAFADGAQGA